MSSNSSLISSFLSNEEQKTQFNKQGYLIVPNAVASSELVRMQSLAKESLMKAKPPLEFEADLSYPGAPHKGEEGSRTVRRLLDAYHRNPEWRRWANHPKLLYTVRYLLNVEHVCLSVAHHNCLMTKSPVYSSRTGWHQDFRYWSYEQSELISAWLALGEETIENGAIHVVPGSHKFEYDNEQFDQDKFFREDILINKSLLAKEKTIELNAGDLLLFHCDLLHRAGENQTNRTKFALVFTYRSRNNYAIKNTRSASREDIFLSN